MISGIGAVASAAYKGGVFVIGASYAIDIIAQMRAARKNAYQEYAFCVFFLHSESRQFIAQIFFKKFFKKVLTYS